MRFEVDGLPAYAYSGGRPFSGDAPTVVFIHGALHDHSVWILQTRYLAHHGWSVLALDLPGHGRSAGPLLSSIEAMARWVLKAVSAVKARAPVVLVGHSMGSLIALEAAAQDAERVAALCLVAGTFPMKVSDALLEAARSDEASARDMINLWSHARLNQRPGTPGPGFSVFVQNRRLMERAPAGTLLNDFQACNDYAAGFERAAALHCPVLMVQGARDLMVPPKSARGLIERLREPQVVTLAGCGHAIMTEAPDALLATLTQWLASVAPAATAEGQPQ